MDKDETGDQVFEQIKVVYIKYMSHLLGPCQVVRQCRALGGCRALQQLPRLPLEVRWVVVRRVPRPEVHDACPVAVDLKSAPVLSTSTSTSTSASVAPHQLSSRPDFSEGQTTHPHPVV